MTVAEVFLSQLCIIDDGDNIIHGVTSKMWNYGSGSNNNTFDTIYEY